MALQPVEAPGPVCQQTAKSTKENKNISTTNPYPYLYQILAKVLVNFDLIYYLY